MKKICYRYVLFFLTVVVVIPFFVQPTIVQGDPIIQADPSVQADTGAPEAPVEAGVKTLTRTADPLVMTAEQLSDFNGQKISDIAVFKATSEGMAAIPFQVDEKDEDGEWIFPFGKKANPEDSNGLFDGKDELVFMAKDTGDRTETLSGLSGVVKAAELTVTSYNGRKAYAYLAAFDKKAPRSAEDYVSYDPNETKITTDLYRMGFDQEAPVCIGSLEALPAGGGDGANPIDRMKVRGDSTTIGIPVRLTRDEEDFKSKAVAYIDGPVRIIRRTKNSMTLPLGIPTPSAVIDNVFYRSWFYFPAEVYVPFNPVTMAKWLFIMVKDAVAYSAIDLNNKAFGTVFYNSNNLDGTVIDGQMSEREKNLDLSPFDWLVMAHKNKARNINFGWMNRLIIDEQVATVLKNWLAEKYPEKPAPPEVGTVGYYANLKNWLKEQHPDFYDQWQPGLYYMDDITHVEAPETYPGSIGAIGFIKDLAGFVAGLPDDLPKFESGVYRLTAVVNIIPGYEPGDEADQMNIIDRPLTVTGAPMDLQRQL